MSADEPVKAEERTAREKDERTTYESLREEVKKRLAEVKEAVTAEKLRLAVDEAANRLRELGGHTADALSKAQAAVRKDLAAATQRMGPNWNSLSEQSADLFAVWKDRGAIFLGQAAASVGEWLKRTGERIEPTEYKTGEMTSGGTFECTACAQQVVLKHAGHIPPCPNCMKTEFRRR